jgi:hypothetical protein
VRTRTPAQHRAEYTWLRTAEVKDRIGVDSEDMVRDLIRRGELEAIDVSRSKKPRYRVSPEAVERFLSESRKRVTG